MKLPPLPKADVTDQNWQGQRLLYTLETVQAIRRAVAEAVKAECVRIAREQLGYTAEHIAVGIEALEIET